MDICFYLHAHQPRRLKDFSIFDVGKEAGYFDESENKRYLRRVIDKSYLPTNRRLLDLIKKTDGDFKVSFSVTGTLLEQLERYAPEVITSFQNLYQTGSVEFISETYYHSLASIYSPEEFRNQVRLQEEKLEDLFGAKPEVFRNTELAYSNEVGALVSELGYRGVLTEGADRVLEWRSPNFVYSFDQDLSLLLKNYRLSDDIAFRFSEENWSEYPLDASKLERWISALEGSADVVNLFMDYETFGEHQWEQTGIFEFLEAFPVEILKNSTNNFVTPSEAFDKNTPKGKLDVPEVISWADTERDLSAWQGNDLQKSVLKKIYSIEEEVKRNKDSRTLEDWRHLQTTDHFYYMCTKWFADGDVHKYFNPYNSPYEAYINYVNVLEDLEHRLENEKERQRVRVKQN